MSRSVPYPSFGLTALLDFEPFELPDQLEETYSTPTDAADIIAAAWAIVDLLRSTSDAAGELLDSDFSTPWRKVTEARLQAAGGRPRNE